MNEVDDYYSGFLDPSFDAAFGTMNLPWLPWVGTSYRSAKNKTIVLGESLYAYGKSDSYEKTRLRILKEDSLRRRHMEHGIRAKFKSRYLRNFERAVFLKSRPTATEREQLWSQVIFHNLVLRLLPSRQSRPSDFDYEVGWQQFFEVATAVSAQRCVVYGTEKRKVDALLKSRENQVLQRRELERVGRQRAFAISIMHDDCQLDFLFIRHPSAFFAWDEWGAVLRKNDMCPISFA